MAYPEQVKMEYILCAAIWYKTDTSPYTNIAEGREENISKPKNIDHGYVICGHRHHSIIQLHGALMNMPTRQPGAIQGFLTSYNRFVGREEAFLIAAEAEQLKDGIVRDRRQLHSEDLY